jgi:Family of unknown function (DUF6152)
MRMKLLVALAAGGLLLNGAAMAVVAHHAFNSEFDAAKPIKLTGTVKKMEWINPHSWLTIDVKRPDGTVETWEIEAGAPNAMFRRGFNRNSLPIGTEVVVNGFQAKDGRKRANGRDISFPDGKKLFMGSSGTGAPGDDPVKP